RQDAHSTARCPFHGKMPIPRQDAHSTARCPFHGKMPILQVRPKAVSNPSRPWRRAPTLKIIPLLSNAYGLGYQACNLNVLLSNTYHQGELAIANSW
ncbi:MAG: hypothetical protein F6J98_30930, partial [Moorea sp. SIO4G2]|nr:hypothetical protein [Moorena sp. SIO4G2]